MREKGFNDGYNYCKSTETKKVKEKVVEYRVQRKLAEYAKHGGIWEDIYLPVRVIKNGKIILQISNRESQVVEVDKIYVEESKC